MTQVEAKRLVDWAESEGWNPGTHDAETLWKADQDAFLAMVVDEKLAGGGAIFRHSSSFGFMGLFIMTPEFRGQGLRRQLWVERRDRLRERLGEKGVVGLDGVDAMLPFYARGGFEPAYRHCRFSLDVSGRSFEANRKVRKIDHEIQRELLSFDQGCFPGERSSYVSAWLQQPEALLLGSFEGDLLNGYSVLRPCRSGWKVGPLYANGADAARALLQECCRLSSHGTVSIDVPENNVEGWKLCESLGMEQVFQCTRMYLGNAPDLHHDRIFGITCLEAG